MKKLICLLFSLLIYAEAAEDISGFWKKLGDNGQPECLFGVYQHEGIYYGRIIGTYNDQGEMNDTIYKPSGRADGIVGQPYMCGLDIIYGLQDTGASFSGTIVDPTKGKTYNCELWLDNGNLIVRGKLFIFGRNLTWYPLSKDDIPKGFKLPDMSKFTPSIPQVN